MFFTHRLKWFDFSLPASVNFITGDIDSIILTKVITKKTKSGTKCQAHRIAFTLETKLQGKGCDVGRMEVSEPGLWSSGTNSFLKRKGRAGQFGRGICHSKTFMGTHAYETGSEYSWDRWP